jgi:hypothetical protein
MASKVDGDMIVSGELKCGTFVPPTNSFGNSNVKTTDPITANKLYHQHQKALGQKHTDTAAAERRVIHVAVDAGTLISFEAMATVANIGDSTVTVNLYKNGSSILSSVPSLTSSNAAFARVAGTFSNAAYVAGDVFEVVITISAGTGTLAKGVNGVLISRELSGG